MSKQTNTLHALLIGINYYFPRTVDTAPQFSHLKGCVRDIEAMEAFLKTRLSVRAEQIIKLIISNNNGNEPTEPKEQWPTYDNMAAAFQQLINKVQADDQVIVHYSGHGGRARTIFPPDVKSSPIDEGLAPTDIGLPSGQYMRDVELAYYLKTLSDKGALVTVFLDCCHSGGMTRSVTAQPRGTTEIDETPRPANLPAEMLQSWQTLTANAPLTRAAASLTASGLPHSDDWVLLAACRPQESAYEDQFDGEQRGALSYWLLNILHNSHNLLTYKQLHQQVMAPINTRFSNQRPQLHGAGDRILFSKDRLNTQFAATITRYHKPSQSVVLNAGSIQGIRNKAQFAIFPLNAADLSDFEQAVAWTTVRRSDATTSTAQITEFIQEPALIEPGAQAVLINPATPNLVGYIGIDSSVSTSAANILKAVHQGAPLAQFINWADADHPADFFVTITADGFYELQDTLGKPIPRLNPKLAITDPNAAEKVISRLIHLTRYRNVKQITNSDSRASNTPQFTFEWVGYPPDHIFGLDKSISLLIRNDSLKDFDITILDLAPDWSITQIYPETSSEANTFAPREKHEFSIETYLEANIDEETNTYKLFASAKGTNFRLLELPSLDAPITRSVPTINGSLEQLLAQLTLTNPQPQPLTRSAASKGWSTAQVELHVRR